MVGPQQVLNAGLAVVFFVAMFFTSHLFIESRSAKHLIQGMNDAVLVKMSHPNFLP
jgi:hypothetical protein